MPVIDELRIPPEFDMPPARMELRRAHLALELVDERRSPSRRRRRRWRLALAAAVCAAVAGVPAIDLLDSDGSRTGVIDKAVAAVSSDDATYHLVTLFTVRHETEDPRVLDAFDFEGVDAFEDVSQFVDMWIGPDERRRTRLYEVERGKRGPLVYEITQGGSTSYQYDARANVLAVMRAHRAHARRRAPSRARPERSRSRSIRGSIRRPS